LTEAVESSALATAQQQAGLLEAALRKNAELVGQLNQELACSGAVNKQGTSYRCVELRPRADRRDPADPRHATGWFGCGS